MQTSIVFIVCVLAFGLAAAIEDWDYVDPRAATRVAEIYPLICFSVHPHLTCPVGTQSAGVDGEQTGGFFERKLQRLNGRNVETADFVCMPNHRRARELLKKVAQGNVIEQVRSDNKSWMKHEVEMKLEIETMNNCIREQPVSNLSN